MSGWIPVLMLLAPALVPGALVLVVLWDCLLRRRTNKGLAAEVERLRGALDAALDEREHVKAEREAERRRDAAERAELRAARDAAEAGFNASQRACLSIQAELKEARVMLDANTLRFSEAVERRAREIMSAGLERQRHEDGSLIAKIARGAFGNAVGCPRCGARGGSHFGACPLSEH